MHFCSNYRVLKTSWGIAIDVEGLLSKLSSHENVIVISDKSLTSNEREQIELGLQSVLLEIKNDEKYYIDLQSIKFNYCDFQLDGLYWASRNWFSEAIDLKIPEPDISYDKTSNKYLFRAYK